MTAVVVRISAVTDRRYSLTGRADWLSIPECRQAERRPVHVRRQIEKIVLRIEEPGHVVTRAKIAIRFDTRVTTARHVIRHEIDDGFQAAGMEALEKLAEFLLALRRFLGVIRTDVEVILDRVGTAGEPLE